MSRPSHIILLLSSHSSPPATAAATLVVCRSRRSTGEISSAVGRFRVFRPVRETRAHRDRSRSPFSYRSGCVVCSRAVTTEVLNTAPNDSDDGGTTTAVARQTANGTTAPHADDGLARPPDAAEKPPLDPSAEAVRLSDNEKLRARQRNDFFSLSTDRPANRRTVRTGVARQRKRTVRLCCFFF